MRILMVAPYLPPEGGGLERYADQIATGLARRGHEVTLLGHATVARDETRDGVRRVGVPIALRLSNTPLGTRMFAAVRQHLRATRPDLVSVHTPVPGSAELAALAARSAGVPYVVTYHAGRLSSGSPFLSFAAFAHRHTLERLLVGGASARIAVSSYVAEHVFGRRSSFLVPPGVDTERFRAVADSVPGRILFVGPIDNAYRWKGLATLAAAFERIAQDVPEATLHLVGTGDLVGRYQNWSREKGLAGRVVFRGRLDDEALVREYSEASVVTLPSWTAAESFGMVLAEANACSRPVVASRVGGIPSFVTHEENGLLVHPKFATGLADALERILEDPGLARILGERGRAKVLAEHRWSDLVERTELAYETVRRRRLGPAGERARLPG